MSAELAYRGPELVQVPSHMIPSLRPARSGLGKTVFDVVLAIHALPFVGVTALALLILNPFFNPGPLIFRQERLGHRGRPFHLVKFRTMMPAGSASRGPMDGVESDRITPLGHILRRLRIDELPNFLNVLRGEMSVIGPRPDASDHARVYLEQIPHYGERFQVKPGITGLAQIMLGYAEGLEATALKADYDRRYVAEQSHRMDAMIALRTVKVVLSGFGAK